MKTLSGKLIGIVLACTAAVLCMGFIPVYAAAETIAQFSFTGGTAGADFKTVTSGYGDKDSGYSASTGVLNSSAKLFASVEGGTTLRGLEWSAEAYGSETCVPVMPAAKDKTWGDEPYFLIKASTAGYENITFSAELGGTNKGPRDWRLEVSTNGGVSYTPVKEISLSTNKTMLKVFDNTALSGSDNKSEIYIRMIASSTTNIGGNDFTSKSYKDGGEAAINNVVISGTKILPVLSAPTASIPNGSSVTVSRSLTLGAPEGAAITYTVNGGPVQSYTQPITPFEGQGGKKVTISVTASKSGYIDSTASFEYNVELETLDAPVIADIADTVTVDTLINVTAKQGAVIKYTVNGGAEQIYDSTAKIFAGLGGRTAVLKLWAEMEGHSNSPYTDVTYTVMTDLTVLTDDETLKTGTAYKIRHSCAVENAVVIVGFYNANGDLVQCSLNPEEITIPSDSGITRVDVMLWHSLISMKPVTSKVVKAVE